ncbi:Ig-like domain repeat protein [Amycolatopsis taiwanensis]|uniref:Bacterial Ig-like domain-containing protein n=1 Tax=Amycolatopsis taiwanensis TaxID=342230 RepID=A0A9W6QXM2_9PSEU|nr:Ig-like domain repeat protein [Amycolatopsis taiwanensis]GLY63932.1 hypothetical protein Atai01_05510 [Amycolatopsis taiwanensis]
MALLATAAMPAVATAGMRGPMGPAGPAVLPFPFQAGSPLVQETFTNATAPEFTAVGSACLTGAPPVAAIPPLNHPPGGCPAVGVGPVPPNDAAPFGFLRLTDASRDQAGAVLYNHAIPASFGLNVTFDQWQYGTTTPEFSPADGISFFLVNGNVDLNHPGAFGGSLGYAQKLPDDNPENPFLPGVPEGYLGVGLDVLGNFFGDWEHRGFGCPEGLRSPAGTIFRVPAPGPNMVTVRGPGNGTEGYCFWTATTSNFGPNGPWPSTLPGSLHGPTTVVPPEPEAAQQALEPSRRRVNVVLTPAPAPQLIVTIDFNDGTGPHRVLDVPAPPDVPNTYKFGFAASTGLFTDVHLLRNVSINSEEPIPPERESQTCLKASAKKVKAGDKVTLTADVTCNGSIPTGTVTFFMDGVEIATVPLIDGRAVLRVRVPPGVHTFTARYNGNETCTPSTSNTVTVIGVRPKPPIPPFPPKPKPIVKKPVKEPVSIHITPAKKGELAKKK